MKLSREEVIHIAALARMGLSEAEIEKAREQLANILENFEVLKKLTPPMFPPRRSPSTSRMSCVRILPGNHWQWSRFWPMPPTAKRIYLNCARCWNKET